MATNFEMVCLPHTVSAFLLHTCTCAVPSIKRRQKYGRIPSEAHLQEPSASCFLESHFGTNRRKVELALRPSVSAALRHLHLCLVHLQMNSTWTHGRWYEPNSMDT